MHVQSSEFRTTAQLRKYLARIQQVIRIKSAFDTHLLGKIGLGKHLGHQVTLLEQGPIPNPLAASGDHHRIIRRAYGKAAGYGRLISEAYEAWDEMWHDLGASHLDQRGFLCISREPGDEAARQQP